MREQIKMPRCILIAALSTRAFAACIPLAGDRILGVDLALANPDFSSLPAGMTIAYAPAPGVMRIFAVAELNRIARANRITLSNPAEVCFEIPMRSMTEVETKEAMLRSLPAGTELTIVELPKSSVPAGRLEFALGGLEPAVNGARLWRGSVRYGETLKMPVWARVTVERKYVAVVAGKDLPLNVPIDPNSLRLETVSVPLDSERIAERIEDVLGRVPKKPVHAGEPIPLAILNLPPVVHRGDAIRVEVRSGATRLVFDAIAQAAAGNGEMVDLRNPDSGRIFRARVEESGHAVVVVPSRESL
jgi:flagella basal body P-ring formation protein FlgA